MTADITLRGPGDVLAVLPYQLGYHPTSCVVAVSLRGRSVGMVARTDLPPDEHVDSVVSALVEPLQRDGATSVILLGYEDVPDASQPALLALVARLEAAHVEVVDVVVVRDGRRYSPVCSEPCCPPEGIPLPDPADVPAVAEFVARGRAPLPSRSAVERIVGAEPELSRGVADAVALRWRMPRRRRRAAVAWRLVLRHESQWSAGPAAVQDRADRTGSRPGWRPQVVADAAIGLADIAWRDGLVAWLAPGVLPLSAVDRDVVALMHTTLPAWGGMGSDKGWHGTAEEGASTRRGAPGRARSAPDRPSSAGAGVGAGAGGGRRPPAARADDGFDAIVRHGLAGIEDGLTGSADGSWGGPPDDGCPEMPTDDVDVTPGEVVSRTSVEDVDEMPVEDVDGTPGEVVGGSPGAVHDPRRGRTVPTEATVGADERRVLLQRLLELCRAVPDECDAEAAAVCTVAAHLAWVEGDGAVARAAVDRALRLAPEYRLAQLLLRLVDAGVRLPRRDGGAEGEALSRAG
jgi:hypothetical protein